MPGPLASLKILDSTTLLPGPFATMTLADLGAEVLSIASRSQPDSMARIPPFLPGGVSAPAAWLGRNKRFLSLNLKHVAALEVMDRLLDRYDIVIEQFRPGVMDRLGLGYDSLRKKRGDLIYRSLTGYGQTGPLRDRAGHDINYLARSGLMSYSGRKKGGPSLTGMQIADLAAGSQGVITALLAAVVHRQVTGWGQYLDVAMTDGVMAFHGICGSLYDFYQTADGRRLSFGGLEPKFSRAFFTALGRPDLIEGGVTPPNLEEVKGWVAEIIRGRTLDQWMAVFQEVDACVEPALSLSEALSQPQARERGMVAEVPLPGGGTVRQVAHPIKFSATPPEYRHAGKPRGADTAKVMRDLGFGEDQVRELAESGLFT